VVVGAGAAGLSAAIFAARAGERVLLLETRPRPGAKIRVSGGGRCNILPSRVELADFHTEGSLHSLRNVLFSWPLAEVTSFFEEELSIPLKVEETGKVFPRSDRAQDVVDALLAETRRVGVRLEGSSRVSAIRPLDGVGAGFELTVGGRRLGARRLVLATGGLSLPRTGSDGGGIEMARELGHEVSALYPALVPLVATEEARGPWKELAGVSLPVRLRAVRGARILEEREGDFLLTHRGFSGPVVLDMSRHLAAPGAEGTVLVARWGGSTAPDWDSALRRGGGRSVIALLREHLPRRLGERLLAGAGLSPDLRAAALRREDRLRLVECLEAFPLPVGGNEGYATAEVTAGGIPLAEVSPRTLESRRVPGLHLCGEMLDATGRIGGYNFLWAWVTGRKAGEGAAGTRSRGGTRTGRA
jgi:hypothetical protein